MVPGYEDFVVVVVGSRGSYTVEAEGPGGIRFPPADSPHREREELRTELGQI
jgi:hypothetical protein